MATTPTFDKVQWHRLAKPQPDQYDLTILSGMEHDRWGWTKETPTAPTFCDGHIALRPVHCFSHNYRPATEHETGLEWNQTEYLNQWVDGYATLTGFLDEFWPHIVIIGSGKGCSSGHHERMDQQRIHAVYVTINDSLGCAQGIYHELGHLRLEALGIKIDTHDGTLLLNPPEELYTSSVRHDCKRPMSAVLHGVYAWLMFGENDYWNHRAGLLPAADLQNYVAPNLPKIAKGIAEIQRYGRFTREGEAFISSVYLWGADLLERWNEYVK